MERERERQLHVGMTKGMERGERESYARWLIVDVCASTFVLKNHVCLLYKLSPHSLSIDPTHTTTNTVCVVINTHCSHDLISMHSWHCAHALLLYTLQTLSHATFSA